MDGHRLSSSGGVRMRQEEMSSAVPQPRKVIDCGHTSKCTGAIRDEIGRTSDSRANSGGSMLPMDTYDSSNPNQTFQTTQQQIQKCQMQRKQPMQKQTTQQQSKLQMQQQWKQPMQQAGRAMRSVVIPVVKSFTPHLPPYRITGAMQPPSSACSSIIRPAQPPAEDLMFDHAEATPRYFRHICPVCSIKCFSKKQWIVHQRSTIHLGRCKLLLEKYLDLDCETVLWPGAAGKDDEPLPSPSLQTSQHCLQKVGHGSHSGTCSPSPHYPRDSEGRWEKRSSRSRSPHSTRYTSRTSDQRQSPPRRSGERRSPRRRSDETRLPWRRTAKRRSPPKRSEERRLLSRRSDDRRSPPRRTAETRSPTRRSGERRSPRRMTADTRQYNSLQHSYTNTQLAFTLYSGLRHTRLDRMHIGSNDTSCTSDDSKTPGQGQVAAEQVNKQQQMQQQSKQQMQPVLQMGQASGSPFFSAAKSVSSAPHIPSITVAVQRPGGPRSIVIPPVHHQPVPDAMDIIDLTLSPSDRQSPAKDQISYLNSCKPLRKQSQSPPRTSDERRSSPRRDDEGQSPFRRTAETQLPPRRSDQRRSPQSDQSLSEQSDLEALVKILSLALRAERTKMKASSSSSLSSSKGGKSSSSSTASSSSFSSTAKKELTEKPSKANPSLQTSERSSSTKTKSGKSSAPTMVKLKGISSFVSRNDVTAAVELFGKTKSVLLFRSKLEAIVCFEKEEDAKKLKSVISLDVKGVPISVVREKETVSNEQNSNPKESETKVQEAVPEDAAKVVEKANVTVFEPKHQAELDKISDAKDAEPMEVGPMGAEVTEHMDGSWMLSRKTTTTEAVLENSADKSNGSQLPKSTVDPWPTLSKVHHTSSKATCPNQS